MIPRPLAALAIAAALAPAAFAAPAPAGAAGIVLVHGAYADGSCWSDVIALLQRDGYRATAVQNPLDSLADDVAATRRALALQDGPTILVGHSWAGTVISEAGDDAKVVGLVYVSARAPDAGEDYGALAAKFPPAPASAGLVRSGGFAQLDEEHFLRDFAGDLPPERARVLYAEQGRIADTLFASRTSVAAWRTKPSWYAVTTQDRTTAPELQRFVAARMKAHTVEIVGSHLSIVSHAREVADLIETAANQARPR